MLTLFVRALSLPSERCQVVDSSIAFPLFLFLLDMLSACAGGTPALDDLLGGASSQPAAASTSNLADLLGGDHAPSTSTSGNASSFADLLSQPTAGSSPQYEPFTAFEKDGIRVVFRASKPAGQEAVTDITASYSNARGQAITDFSLQVSFQSIYQLCITH